MFCWKTEATRNRTDHLNSRHCWTARFSLHLIDPMVMVFRKNHSQQPKQITAGLTALKIPEPLLNTADWKIWKIEAIKHRNGNSTLTKYLTWKHHAHLNLSNKSPFDWLRYSYIFCATFLWNGVCYNIGCFANIEYPSKSCKYWISFNFSVRKLFDHTVLLKSFGLTN